MQIRFKNDPTYYMGRNGVGTCIGIDIDEFFQKEIVIRPINGKENVANCSIHFPVNIIPEVISELQKQYNLSLVKNISEPTIKIQE